MPTTDGTWRLIHQAGALCAWPLRQAFAASIGGALALALFLAVRRFSGALSEPLPSLELVATATLAVAWAVAAKTYLSNSLASWSAAIVLLLLAAACSFPGERAIDWLVWLTAFGLYLGSHQPSIARPKRRNPPPAADADGHVLQQLTRTRTADGHDAIHGALLAEFAPGERTTTLYVAFCPPFERLPQVDVESSATTKVVQTLHNGVQLEVRLPRAAETPTTASVDLFATDAE